MEKVTLWTIQTLAAWDVLQKTGSLKGDGRRVWREFKPAYRWLMSQMKGCIPNYKGNFPIWAWVQKPDLRCVAYGIRGEKYIRIELFVPKEQVLMSCFDKWHAVLGGWYQVSDDIFFAEDRYDFTMEDLEEDDTEEIQDCSIEESWQRIFDIGRSDCVQAVTPVIRLSQVKKVTYFTSR